MSEEQPKKKGRGPGSTAAGDLLIYKDADGIEWPGRHVRFNKGKTMKLPNKKQVACTITVQLDGYAKPSIVPYLDVTYLPKGDTAAKIAAEPIEQPQPPIWRSVMDVVEENDPTNVYWGNTPQKAYVMVDEDGVVFTYEVEPGIETLADLERLMQLSGWQFGEDAVQPPTTVATPYAADGEPGAAEPIVDAIQEDRAAEEPKTVPTEMLALRWNNEILGPERLGYRIPGRQHIYGDRHYVIQTPGDNVIFAPGVTSILKATMPKPEELFKWAVEKFRSWEEYQRYMTLAQGKGSVIHGAIADAINGVLPDFQDTAAWLSYLAAACSRNGCKGMEREWLTIVQRSVASVRQWAADYKVVFLMVEKALYTPSGYAGQVDFLLEVDSHIQNVKSTKAALREAPRRIIAIVDLKTGSDSDQYPAQLAYYRRLLLEGFPHIKKVIAERYPDQLMGEGNYYNIPLYLLFPKTSWRKAPTYSFLDRTLKADEYASNEMQHHIELFKFKRRKPAGVTRLTGPANFNVTNEGVLKYTTLEEVWMDKIAQGDLEPVEDINEEDEAD